MPAGFLCFRTAVLRSPHGTLDNFGGRFRLFSQPNLNTPGVEWLTVTPNGFFGIGTSAPLGNFHISADNSSAQDRPVQFVISGRTNSNLKLHLGVRTELSPPVAQISFVEEGVAWRNIALGGNGGNVGIGTLTPRERLDVNGNVRAVGAVFANAGVFDVACVWNRIVIASAIAIVRTGSVTAIVTQTETAAIAMKT